MESIETVEQFQSVIEGDFVLIYFHSDTCNVCINIQEQLKPFEELLPIYSVNTEKRDIAGQCTVFTVPTVLIYSNGREMLRTSRFIDFDAIERIISLRG